ncbi:MAG: hypothetical protein VKJ64_03540 [Leptolyngbyaceae bacterium]|nr:hypothetical protein [Leptolyngbyaceae bacterium]
MDTHLIPLPIDSRISQQSIDHTIDHTILSQMMVAQLTGQHASQKKGAPSSSSVSYELGGRLSFELVKYACRLAQSPPLKVLDHGAMREVARCSGVRSGFAPPILPMHQRDRTILDSLFGRDDMFDIHIEIQDQLGKLVTEPCWDDDPYGFLSNYL